MGALDATRGAIGGHAFGEGAISAGAIPRPGGVPKVLGLSKPQDYRGRVNAAIPTAGIKLNVGRGGTKPYTYAVTDLPAGLAFAAATRIITGTPTAAGTETVTYTVTDSATPAASVAQTFEFPVVAANALITRDDWDNRGYRLESRTTYLLALFEGTVDTGFSNTDIWRRPPQSGTERGLLLDDDGNTITDYADMTFTEGGESIFIQRIQTVEASDRVTFYESSSLHFGTYARNVLGSPSLFLRIGNDEQEVPYERAFGNDLQFRRSTPDLGPFLRDIDNGVRVLIAIAAP